MSVFMSEIVTLPLEYQGSAHRDDIISEHLKSDIIFCNKYSYFVIINSGKHFQIKLNL